MGMRGWKADLGRAEAPAAQEREVLEQRLAARGVRLIEPGTERPDVVLAGEVVFSVRIDGLDDQHRGIPIWPEAELHEFLLTDEPGGGAVFTDHDELAAGSAAKVLDLLRAADWTAFAPQRDLPLLRETLTALENSGGITEVHRFATEQLVARGARLRHQYAHPLFEEGGQVESFGLSPCGRYLATGRWGDDAGAGILQIWELATGRAVNEIAVDGGIGWRSQRDLVQWSADGSRLALGFCTNLVGVWDPFGQSANPHGYADVTDGGSEGAIFALSPDGRRAFISMRTAGAEVMGCIAALDRGQVVYADQFQLVRGQRPELLREPIPAELKHRLGASNPGRDGEPDEYEWSFGRVRWSRDGSRLAGHRGSTACAVDLPGGRMRWLVRTDASMPLAWSPDDRFVAAVGKGELVVLDAETGDQVGESVEQDSGMPHWGVRDGAARLAIVLEDGGGVDVHDEDGRRFHLDIDTTEQLGEHFGEQHPWAWEPAGEHGACLTGDDRIEVWSLGEEPALVRSLHVPEGTTAVLWGAGGVLVVLGENTLRFVRALSGQVLGDMTFDREPDEDSRPVEEGEFLGDWFQEDSFPLDDSTWCTIARPAVGPAARLVIAPEGRRDDLDAVLSWTVDRRFAWPARWGELDLVPGLEAAEEALEG
ncbi:hypothetical protein LZ318_07525 [Saccharopolyspora indica]|uniref:WD40 repeat domain-containing protein n=1 Tax=Saccharopolyspora indica TaxID=1229659 RepID=UPI0022EB4AFD|nr:hypothetical protein [Saccharopolyspora indica]MDA3649482.1 hypothetical protein [Saccharopolyspora indica]